MIINSINQITKWMKVLLDTNIIIHRETKDPNNKDFDFNLGLIYKEQGKLSRARQYFETASDKAGGWGMAIFSIGLLYEQAARDCTFDFKTKLVYLLAQETYRRAVNIDP